MKRTFDIIFSILLLTILVFLLFLISILIWLQDFNSPFYLAPRVSKGGGKFTMIKLRTMVINADKTRWIQPNLMMQELQRLDN